MLKDEEAAAEPGQKRKADEKEHVSNTGETLGSPGSPHL